MYFARKFEPIINLSIIDTLEVWLYGDYPAGNTFKQIYHNMNTVFQLYSHIYH